MQALSLSEPQLVEEYFRSGGGMNGVHLLHKPTGIRIRCGRERSQGLNRFCARRILVEELEARQHGQTRHEAKAEKLREEKIRRQHHRGHSAPPPHPWAKGTTRIPGDATPTFAEFIARMEAYTLRPQEG
ncbi:MAG: peptide chain release factor-like protein [Verrucomicrobia bacterium]|nr:peptide chain release factor-like protein [Verrucomicrobiota bacterium]